MNRLCVYFALLICLFARCSLAQDDNQDVIILTEQNWRNLMDNEWLVQFHAPWCPACRSLTKQWKLLGSLSNQLGVSIAKIDVTADPSLSGRFFVTALPTIFHVINGEFRQYRGPRDAGTLRDFITEKKWKNLDVVPWYFYPDSYLMGAASYFFKLSHALKDLNTYLLDEYMIPSWMSYILFAIVTIFLGAMIGLLFVCIVDFIFPPKHLKRKSFAQVSDVPINTVDDIREDDLDDLSSSEDDVKDPKSPESPKTSGASPAQKSKETKTSDTEPTIEDLQNDDEDDVAKSSEVRKRRTRKAD